jgi:hypothetical protein
MLLAGCETSSDTSPSKLPPAPADIQACFRQSGVFIPDRALTVAEVESLWKQDRIRIAVMQRCGNRLLAWYGELRAGWK